MGQPSTACTDWRFAQATDARNWIETAHTNLSDPDSWLDTTLCIRFLLYNSGDKAESDGYRFEYTTNGGSSWNAVTAASSYVRATDHPYRANDQATSQELGSGTFDEGYWVDDGQSPSYDLTNGQESELEFSFQFRSADCPGHTIGLRLIFDDGVNALDGYTYADPSATFRPVASDAASNLMLLGAG